VPTKIFVLRPHFVQNKYVPRINISQTSTGPTAPAGLGGASLLGNWFKCNCSWVIIIRQNMNFNSPPPSTFDIFFHIKCLCKSCLSFEDLSAYKISWSDVGWCKFRIHLRSSNDCYFGMVEGTGLESMALVSPSLA
jgi:hypothetical protein